MTAPPKVLVVDDEPDIRHGVSCWLNAAGYETLSADDGDQGVASARLHTPHAIVMDVRMPRKDGMEALSELRAKKETLDIPVVMLSASLQDEQRALDAGARFFIHKPYDCKKLVSAVKTVIGQ